MSSIKKEAETSESGLFRAYGFCALARLAPLLAGAAPLVHALLPFLCETTASRNIRELHQRIEGRGK
ncbi:MAG: DUF6356 family protein [Aliihoeflea sp.]